MRVKPEYLGSAEYKARYKVKYAYHSGSMYRGIASKELVIRMGQAGLMGFLGTAAMSLSNIEENINAIQSVLQGKHAYGMNLICNLDSPETEMKIIELYLKKEIRHVEASAFMQITPALAFYRLKGLKKNQNGKIESLNKIIAKISRPETAEYFMSPPPKRIIDALLTAKKINEEQARLAENIAMCDDICVEADSGGHTDRGISTVLLPTIQRLRDEIMEKYSYSERIQVGLAGGIGTPEAVAAAFVMGADFVSTGSINQCTVEAGMSDTVKDLLQDINVQDTDYAPAGDMFEIGAKVQVLKKGTLFSARANKLYSLYNQYESLDDLPDKIKKQIQETYFKKGFEEIFAETATYFNEIGQKDLIEKAKSNGKIKMALVFRWYFNYSMRLAFAGDTTQRVDYQVHTGPALGAFNQWVKGTALENWRERHVDQIAEKLMQSAADILSSKFDHFTPASDS